MTIEFRDMSESDSATSKWMEIMILEFTSLIQSPAF